jgi:hypothetical protein
MPHHSGDTIPWEIDAVEGVEMSSSGNPAQRSKPAVLIFLPGANS